MNLQPQLIGNLLRTRPLLVEDFENLYEAASDPLIWEQHPDPLRYRRDIFQNYFASGIKSKGCLIVEDKDTGEVVGSSRYYDFSTARKEVSIGYTFLARRYWGGAYNRELKHLMITHAFTFADTVLFDVGSENLRSRGALEKIRAKLLSQKEKKTSDGRKVTALVYGIYKAEFKGLK